MTDRTDELPKHNDLFWPVVDALRQLDGAADNDQLVEKVSEILGLGDELTAIPHKVGPQTEIGYRVAWVKSWLKWGAMVDNPRRGVWVLTELGQNASETEIKNLPRRRRAEAGNRKQPANVAEPDIDADVEAPPVSEELDTFEQDEWQNEVLEIIKNLQPQAFERLARRLLLSLGFSNVEVVGRTGDGGIDLLGVVKINDILTFRVLAQCKRYKGTVSPKDIRDFRGAMQGRTDKGIYITSGRYTREAKKEASRDGVPEIDLIDGEAFANLLKRLEMGINTKFVEKVTIIQDYFDGI